MYDTVRNTFMGERQSVGWEVLKCLVHSKRTDFVLGCEN